MLYYFGDNIYFHLCILGKIEEYLENGSTLEIKTLKEYSEILKILFGNLISTLETHEHDIQNDDISITEYFGINHETRIKLKKNILFSNDELKNKYTSLNLVCRWTSNKYEQIVSNIIKDTFLCKEHMIINIVPDMSISEKIYILNQSILFITDDLNYFSFSSNCNIKNLCLLLDYSNYKANNNLFNNPNFYIINICDEKTIPMFRINFLKNNNMLPYMKKRNNYSFVSCICPTYNRINFFPYLIKIFQNQKYPKEYRELIILDDSPSNNVELIKKLDTQNNIKYIHINTDKPLPIGKKRNLMHQLVSGDYIVCFDDDDYYSPERINYSVDLLSKSKIKFAGSSKMLIYYTDINKIYEFGPYHQNHATNGTFAYHRSHIFKNFYDDSAMSAEEKYFLNNYQEKMIQLDITKTMVCIAHNNNTFDKKKVLNSGKIVSGKKINHYVKDKEILNFYKSLGNK